MEILNLDKVTLEDHDIKLGGRVFTIPGRITLGTVFKILESEQELEKSFDLAVFKKSLQTLYSVFKIRATSV